MGTRIWGKGPQNSQDRGYSKLSSSASTYPPSGVLQRQEDIRQRRRLCTYMHRRVWTNGAGFVFSKPLVSN